MPTVEPVLFNETAGGPIKGVPVFQAGNPRGKRYTTADLDDMAENFRRYSVGKNAILPVPTVLGHEEDQQFLEGADSHLLPDATNRSDQPSLGWPDRLYRGDGSGEGDEQLRPDTLYADYDDPPDTLRQLLENKAYNRISAEIYDTPPQGHPGKGNCVRRISLLGGDQPQLKTLGDILRHTSKNREAGARFDRVPFAPITLRDIRPTKDPNCWVCFSEVTRMAGENEPAVMDPAADPGAAGDPAELMQQLADLGVDTSVCENCPPEALAEWVRTLSDAQQPPDEEYDDDTAPMSSIDGYAEDEELEDAPEDKKDEYKERARKMGERARKYAARSMKFLEKYCADEIQRHDDLPPEPIRDPVQAHDDNPAGNPPMQPKKTTLTHQYSEQQIQATVNRAVQAAVDKIVKPAVAKAEKFAESLEETQRRQSVEAFLKLHSFSEGDPATKQIRILPRELDDAEPSNLRNQLMAADASTVVHKFREGKKEVALTAFDLLKRSIEKRPPIKFGERFKDGPLVDTGANTADGRKAWAKATFQKFSEKFKQTGVSEADFVETAAKASDEEYAETKRRWDARAA